MTETVLKTSDEDVMDAVRNKEKVYVAGVKFRVDGYTISPDPETGEELLTADLDRVFKKNVKRCPKDNCNGERIKVKDKRFHSGFRWECNVCNWVQER